MYDRDIRPGDSRVVLELIDASALLWRLHLLGHDVGGRWQPLAAAWRERTQDRYYVFNDVHALMAFLGAPGRGRGPGGRRGARVRRLAEPTTNGMMAREVGLPVARALAAFSRGDYAACVDALLPLRHVAARFGGSNAQRDVLSLTLLEAALRGGDVSLARALASERTRLRAANPSGWVAAARALEAGGDAAHAASARRQAARLRDHFRQGAPSAGRAIADGAVGEASAGAAG